MKKTIITGNLGADAEYRQVEGGHQFLSFSVACGEREIKDSAGNVVKESEWAKCEFYVKPGTSADGLRALLVKGRHIYLEAYDKVDCWIDKNSNEPRAKVIYRVQSFDV